MSPSSSHAPPLALRRLLLFVGALMWLSACGSSDLGRSEHDEREPDSLAVEPIREQGKRDAPTPPDDLVIDQEDDFEEAEDRYPMFERLRYVRRYKDCNEPACMVDFRLALRGGRFQRYQYGDMIDNILLSRQDYEAMQALVNKDSELGALLYSEQPIRCAHAATQWVENHVTVELVVYTDKDTLEYFTHTLSHCPMNATHEPPDLLIDFINDLNRRY